MGSFQQITLGAFCVGGAFWLGHYLNNHPVPENVGDELARNGAYAPLESKTSLLQPGTKIGELPNFQTPARPLVELAENNRTSLPPPSQLAPVGEMPVSSNDRSQAESNSVFKPLNHSTTAIRETNREIVQPDFSQLAASFHNTPLELPPLDQGRSGFENGTYREPTSSQRKQVDQVTQANPHVSVDRRETGARDLFSPFSNPLAATKIESAGPQSLNEPAAGVIRETVHQVQTIPAEFNAEDFSPKLNDRFSATTQMFQQQFANNRDEANRTDTNRNEMKGDSVLVARDAPVDDNEPSNDLPHFPPHPNSVISLNSTPLTSVMLPPGVPILESAPTENSTVTAAEQPISRSNRPMVPFGLSDEEKSNLVRLRRADARQIKLGATKFTDYETQVGDTLQDLSTKFYGRPDFYLDIYMANQSQLRNPAQVPAGMTLKIPVYE